MRAYIAQALRLEQDAKDVQIINRNAKQLNEEAEDALSYQSICETG